jgi:hypothetical protein
MRMYRLILANKTPKNYQAELWPIHTMDSNLRLLGILFQVLNAEIQEWKCLVVE